jgi:RNA polymerase sigma-70 factor (ECF subfamily)
MALSGMQLLEPARPASAAVAGGAEHQEDVELVRRSLAGEPRAVDLLVERLACIGRILAVFNQRMGGPYEPGELAEISQEVLVTFWNRIGSYTGRAALETWAYGFCLNTFMATLRKRKKRAHERLDEENFADARTTQRFADEYSALHRSLAELDPREERVIRLKYFEELTFEQIGAAIRLSPNSVKTCFYRGMKRLEQILRRVGGDLR